MTKKLTKFTADELFSYLSDNLPPIISREKIPDYVGGLVSLASLQKYDCLGVGPKQIPSKGRKVAYLRPDLIEWLMANFYQDISQEELSNER